MKKIGSLISILCIINALMLAGFVGFLWGTGRLDKPKAQAIGDLLRQPGTPEGLRAKLYAIMTPSPTTQTRPATGSGPVALVSASGAGAPLPPAAAQERIDYVQKVLEEERLRLETEAQKQRQEQESLVAQAQKLDARKKELDDRERVYQDSLTTADAKADAAGFQKMMSIFSELKPKQIKDLLTTMPAAEVARYLTAMEPDQAAKVLAEFKSIDEKQLINVVLNKVRGVKDGSGTGAASGTPTATQPLAASATPKAGS